MPNPLLSRVYEGIALCRREHVDLVLAVGGGSVIDTAKGICNGVTYEGDVWDFYTLQTKAENLPAAGRAADPCGRGQRNELFLRDHQ